MGKCRMGRAIAKPITTRVIDGFRFALYKLPILPNEHLIKRLIDYSKSNLSLPHPPNRLAKYLIK